MKDYEDEDWLLTRIKNGKRLNDIAEEVNVSIYTISHHFSKIINNMSIDNVIAFLHECKTPTQLISPKSQIYLKIVNKTQFLPRTAQLRERLWYIEHNTSTPPTCKMCSTPTKWDYTKQNFRIYCSKGCLNKDSSLQTKRIKTNLEKRGVKYPSQSESVKQKYCNTMIKKYGKPYINQDHLTDEAIEILNNKEQLQTLYNTHKTTFRVAKHLHVSQSYVSKKGIEYGITTNMRSGVEEEVVDFFRNVSPNLLIVQNTRQIIPPKELDLFFPDKKIAIETNGLFWHGESNGKLQSYHLEKTNSCKKQNIRLIHLLDYEWLMKNDIVKSRLKIIFNLHDTKIYGRQCEVSEVPHQTATTFFNTTHIQGSRPALKYLGLFYNGELISCMSFSRPRFNSHYQYELLRFSTKLNTVVVGGASKLFKHFIRKYSPTSIISYSDKRWNTGGVYENLGFKYTHTSRPNYWYFNKEQELLSRVAFQKHKLANKLKTFNPHLTEWENMQRNGYDRIWDCGNDVFLWEP